ncbi:MAG: hypothetical protein LQ341_006347 [Variospora aurantia]|nr:MAG: hypothetical protein LQ341_006347 [Variospora aurantia]
MDRRRAAPICNMDRTASPAAASGCILACAHMTAYRPGPQNSILGVQVAVFTSAGTVNDYLAMALSNDPNYPNSPDCPPLSQAALPEDVHRRLTRMRSRAPVFDDAGEEGAPEMREWPSSTAVDNADGTTSIPRAGSQDFFGNDAFHGVEFFGPVWARSPLDTGGLDDSAWDALGPNRTVPDEAVFNAACGDGNRVQAPNMASPFTDSPYPYTPGSFFESEQLHQQPQPMGGFQPSSFPFHPDEGRAQPPMQNDGRDPCFGDRSLLPPVGDADSRCAGCGAAGCWNAAGMGTAGVDNVAFRKFGTTGPLRQASALIYWLDHGSAIANPAYTSTYLGSPAATPAYRAAAVPPDPSTPTSVSRGVAAASTLLSMRHSIHPPSQKQDPFACVQTPVKSKRKRHVPSSPVRYTSPAFHVHKRRRREIKTKRRGASLAETIARGDPWYWNEAQVLFALTDSTSMDVMINPVLARLNKGPSSLHDFLYSSNLSGRQMLTCVDMFTLQSSGLSAAQQSALLGAIQSARARSCRYQTFLCFPRPTHQVAARDKARILRDLSRHPPAAGGKRLFEFPGRSILCKRGARGGGSTRGGRGSTRGEKEAQEEKEREGEEEEAQGEEEEDEKEVEKDEEKAQEVQEDKGRRTHAF